VVADYSGRELDREVTLADPFIVDGWQTTPSIWEVFHRKLDTGGTGADPELATWKTRAEAGVVMVMIVRAGMMVEQLSEEISSCTSIQTAVRKKDLMRMRAFVEKHPKKGAGRRQALLMRIPANLERFRNSRRPHDGDDCPHRR
jgi:hypothetical protein